MITQAFDVQLTVPMLEQPEEIRAALMECHNITGASIPQMVSSMGGKPISIKKLLMVIEMARQENDTVSYETFVNCLHTMGF